MSMLVDCSMLYLCMSARTIGRLVQWFTLSLCWYFAPLFHWLNGSIGSWIHRAVDLLYVCSHCFCWLACVIVDCVITMVVDCCCCADSKLHEQLIHRTIAILCCFIGSESLEHCLIAHRFAWLLLFYKFNWFKLLLFHRFWINGSLDHCHCAIAMLFVCSWST